MRSTKKEEEEENAAEFPPGVSYAEIDEAIDSLVEDGSIERKDVKLIRKMARDKVRGMRRKERCIRVEKHEMRKAKNGKNCNCK